MTEHQEPETFTQHNLSWWISLLQQYELIGAPVPANDVPNVRTVLVDALSELNRIDGFWKQEKELADEEGRRAEMLERKVKDLEQTIEGLYDEIKYGGDR
jgi:hypothetical protein